MGETAGTDSLSSLLERRSEAGVVRATRGTGMWPFVLPRPWNLTPATGEAILIDPVAVASIAAEFVSRVGWPGIDLMSQGFQLGLIDQPDAEVEAAVQTWYEDNRQAVADELSKRFVAYNIDSISATARIAMSEAIQCYRQSLHLSAVRCLMPEFEAVARGVYSGPKQRPAQKDVIEWLKSAVDEVPVAGTAAIESFSLQHFLDDKLFATCFSSADARALGDIPNRHAELHGLASYGSLKGATTLLCVTSYVVQLVDRLRSMSSPRTS
jgi:hypothetical protein